MKKYWTNNKNIIIPILAGTFIAGLLAHGYVMTNLIAYHDGARNIDALGATVSSGRWMLEIYYNLWKFIFREPIATTPLFNGFLTLLITAVISFLIAKMLGIVGKLRLILLSGWMVIFPQMTSLMFYMFVAPFYQLGTLMAVFGVYLVAKRKNAVWKYIVAAILMACSIGTYQANIPIILSLMLMVMLRQQLEENGINTRKFIGQGAKYVVLAAGMFILYLLINKLFLDISGTMLTDYRGINSYGLTTFGGYIGRIAVAYKEFVRPTGGYIREIYPFFSSFMYIFLLIAYLLFVLLPFLDNKIGIWKKIRISVLLLLFPLSINFVYVMCDFSAVHSLMMYGQSLLAVCLLMLSEKYDFSCGMTGEKNKRMYAGIVLSIILMEISFCRFANICYTKAELIQSHFIAYANTLIGHIEETPGYESGMQVLYIGEQEKKDADYAYFQSVFKNINIVPYCGVSEINNYAWKDAMALWCGFNPPVVGNYSGITNLSQIDSMPCYPESGSIKVVDDILVVKFSERRPGNDEKN